MKLILNSNFFEWYDHAFDSRVYINEPDCQILNRRNDIGPDRVAAFKLMNQNGLKIPNYWWGDIAPCGYYDKIVLHTNLMSHCGEDKTLLHYGVYKQMLKNKQDLSKHLIVEFIEPDEPGVSYRELQIGYYYFVLRYQSDCWQSNSDPKITLLFHENRRHRKYQFSYPMWAIDYVYRNNVQYALDFNVSPGISYTGIENIVTAKELVDSLKCSILGDFYVRN